MVFQIVRPLGACQDNWKGNSNYMKRNLISYLLTVLLLLSLTGCGHEETTAATLPQTDSLSPLQTNNNPIISDFSAKSALDTKDSVPEPEGPQEKKEEDKTAIQDELNYLSANRPQAIISCPYCGGSGRESSPCKSCGGSGQVPIPGVTAFAAFVPCSDCRGGGYAVCGQCTFGTITNPNYDAESAAWTERRHELWALLGYSDDEIHRMEIEEAQNYLGIDSNSGNFLGDGYGDSAASETPPGLCRVCYGSGDCPNCGGDGFYQNMFTGEQIACPNCSDGLCWKCGGSGSDS